MDILVNGKVIAAHSPKIQFGVFDEPIEKWALLNEDRDVWMYLIDHDYTLVEDVELPEDYVDGKYFFVDGEFVLNEDWQPPLPSAEERIAELERQLANLSGDTVWDEMAIAIEEGVNEV